MHLSFASIALIVVSAIGVVSAEDPNPNHFSGMCACFNPKYDASCCILGNGYQMNDGNVCNTMDFGPTVKKYQDCCTRSGGHAKCKLGSWAPGRWPPKDSYGCPVKN